MRGTAPAQIPDAKISVCHGASAACSPRRARSSCPTNRRERLIAYPITSNTNGPPRRGGPHGNAAH
jgi:hypothetical protein